jgi:hypothetical protein
MKLQLLEIFTNPQNQNESRVTEAENTSESETVDPVQKAHEIALFYALG